MNEKAIVLFSGGQDSTTCLLWAIKKWGSENVIAVSFDYGQKHRIELRQAMKIAQLYPSLKHKIFVVKDLLPQSALIAGDERDVSVKSDYDPSLPASFTPGRNILFLTLSGSLAASIGAANIVTGVCQTDYSGYPDCRHEFVKAMEIALNIGLGLVDAGNHSLLTIHTPLMFLTKAETWKMAKDLDIVEHIAAIPIVRDMTMTDYNGDTTSNEWGMGKLNNPASQLRAKGYEEAKAKGWV